MSGLALTVDRVAYAYSGREVLRDVTFGVPAGDRVAVVGPNGAGKSTLLGLLAGLLKPARGTIQVGGDDLSALAPRRRARLVALVAQSPVFPSTYSVSEWVSLGRTPFIDSLGREGEVDRRAVADALARTGLTSVANRPIGTLSGGERQRATMAQALARGPSVLLLDEATAHLDLRYQGALMGEVCGLAGDRALTVIAAVHDLNLAAAWFDRLILIADGRILADGPPAAVLRDDLLGSAYGCEVDIFPHPSDGRPVVLVRRK